MYKNKRILYVLTFLMLFTMLSPIQTSYAASTGNVINTLTAPTVSTSSSAGGGILDGLFNFLFEKVLGPIFNVFNSQSASNPAVKVTPLPANGNGSSSTMQDTGSIRGKTIVVDPGHGGSNPGAVANNTRESDNNLAVGLKLQAKLVQAGAKVIMTRDSDRTVAAEGSSLTEELAARTALAQNNHADMFISIHSNENPDSSVAGAMTFYPNGKSSSLAMAVQSALIKETGALDKGTSAATFYVLRNASMPSILVEMGFVSNEKEAAQLQDDAYRNKIATGILNGVAKYFTNN